MLLHFISCFIPCILTLCSKVDWEAFAQANGYKHAASGRNQYAKAKARLGLVGKKASGASTTPKKASEPSSSTGPAITKKTTGVTKNRSCPKVNVASKKLEDSDEDEFISLVKVDNSDE
jgi:hypothetical protein